MLDLRLFVGTIVAFLIGLCAVSAIRKIATAIGFVDNPDRHRKLHEVPIPLGGGIAVWFATWLGWSINFFGFSTGDVRGNPNTWFYPALAFSSLGMLGLGVIDDRYCLRPRHKLAGQVLATLLLVGLGLRIDACRCFGVEVNLGIFAYPLTVFWILLVVNAFNLIDGMDGFCSSLGVVASLAIAFISYCSGCFGDVAVALALAGALMAFLRHNLPPARVYLGDAGSMTIGLMISALSLRACSDRESTTLAIAPLIALMFLPLLDVVAALGRRWLTGRSIFSPDRGHLHHRLKNRFAYRYAALGVAVPLATLGAGSGAFSFVHDTGDTLPFLAVVLSIALLVLTNTFGGSELRLLLLRLQRVFTTPMQSNGIHRRDVRQECHLHGVRDWGNVWNTLLREGEGGGVWRIELSIDMAATGEVYHGLWSSPSKSEDGPTWSVVHSLYAGGVPAGILRVNGNVDACRHNYLDSVENLVRVVENHLEFESPLPTTSAVETLSCVNASVPLSPVQ